MRILKPPTPESKNKNVGCHAGLERRKSCAHFSSSLRGVYTRRVAGEVSVDIQELIENARRNETLLGRLQAFELKLLSCQNWAALLELLLDGLPAQFGLAAIGLRLVDSSGEIKASILRSLDLDKGALLNQIEFHSRLSKAKPAAFSPPPPWQSGLLLPLIRNDDYLGELRLYADDSSRFTSGMATDFMQHLAAVIAACLVMVQQTEEQARLALTDPFNRG